MVKEALFEYLQRKVGLLRRERSTSQPHNGSSCRKLKKRNLVEEGQVLHPYVRTKARVCLIDHVRWRDCKRSMCPKKKGKRRKRKRKAATAAVVIRRKIRKQ
tara:strand:- start:123 stop:428 length:306 start_codon:yes stop_codon:yes gene_type:complete